MKLPTRRAFLSRATVASGALALPWLVPAWARSAAALPPSERINIGLIGLGAMGRGHLGLLLGHKDTQLMAVCDVDRVRREEGKLRAEEAYAVQTRAGFYHGCAAYNDYRELLARPDIDAVLIATPDHWHATQSIDAANAGKDVYCEKPVSLTIDEGRRMVEPVRRSGRVFQTGTQYRSIPTIRQVCDFVRAGGLGRVKSVFTNWQNLGAFVGERFKPYAGVIDLPKFSSSYAPLLPPDPVPDGLDWNSWVGPAAWHPYNHLYHVNPIPGVVPWSFCEDFGAASSTWFQSHAADVIQYALGMETSGPVELLHPADGQFPTLTCKYANGVLLHHVDNWGQVKDLYHAVPANARLAGLFGGLFVGERGWVTTMSTGGPIEAAPKSLFDGLKLRTRDVNIGTNNHHANWFECIHTRARPSAHAEIGHRSASLGHLIILAHKLGRSLGWDPVRELFPDDAQANRLRARARRFP